MADSNAERFASLASLQFPEDVARAIAASNAGLASLQPPATGPRPKYLNRDLTAAGYTIVEGPLKGQVVIANSNFPANTYGHEAYHARVLAHGPQTTPGFGGRYSPDQIGNPYWSPLREAMMKLQAEAEAGKYWGMHPSSSGEEQLASLMGYEAGLPRGTSMADSEVGKTVLNSQGKRDYYFNQTSIPYGGVWEGQAPERGMLSRLLDAVHGAAVRSGFNTVNRK